MKLLLPFVAGIRARGSAPALLMALAVAASGVEAAEAVQKDFDIAGGEALAALKRFMSQSGEQLLYAVDAVEGLTRLKRKYTICTLSNGNIGLLTEMAKRAGLPWDCILSAEVFKAYKPDPRVYLGAAGVFAVPPGQVMLVAAHQDDLAAARGCGLRTAYIERPLENGADRPKDVSPDPANTFHARDIVALAQQLGC